MPEASLGALLAEAGKATDNLRYGIARLRQTNTEQAEREEIAKQRREDAHLLAAEIKEAKAQVERQRSDLKDRLDVARRLAGEITEHIDRYRSKPIGSSWPLQIGHEHWDRSRNTIEDHLRLLERHRSELGYAINDAARVLSDNPHLDQSSLVWAGTSRGLVDLRVMPVIDLVDRGTPGLSTGIGGITIGVPVLSGLRGMLGLKVGFTNATKPQESTTYEPTCHPNFRLPFFPN